MGVDRLMLDPDLQQGLKELEQLCRMNGVQTTLTSTYRTRREQTFLWNRYQSGNSPLPAAPPLHSAHEFGWAFDMVVAPYEAQPIVGGWWETYWGGAYGGKTDPVHFELPGAGKEAWNIGEHAVSQNPSLAAPVQNAPTLWDYGFWALDFTSLASFLFELGYIVYSKSEAEKVLRALHIDPHGRIF